MAAEDPNPAGLIALLRPIGETVLAIVQNRIELASVELGEGFLVVEAHGNRIRSIPSAPLGDACADGRSLHRATMEIQDRLVAPGPLHLATGEEDLPRLELLAAAPANETERLTSLAD